jgi:DNA-binding winged helix-turn-helix (wHTH) protein
MGNCSQPLRFAEFSFEPDSGRLTRDGSVVPLEYQPSVVLSRLLLSAGTVVTRRELAAALWVAGVAIESRPNNHHEIAVAIARSVHDLIF